MPAKRIVVAFNPIAGAGRREAKVAHLMRCLEEAGFVPTLCPQADELANLVAQIDPGELRCVIAAGGDGTISLVANCVPATTNLAIFPLGTENLLARYLGHTANPEHLTSLIVNGEITTLDAGLISSSPSHLPSAISPLPSPRLFSLMLGCGFDAEVVYQLHKHRRGPIRHWTYAWPIVSTAWQYDYPALQVELWPEAGSAASLTMECRWAFVVNVPRYAFGLALDPAASPYDGLLHVVTLSHGSLAWGLRYLVAFFRGRHLRLPGVRVHTATRVRIASPALARYQLDGDPGGELPVEVTSAPQRLRFFKKVPTNQGKT